MKKIFVSLSVVFLGLLFTSPVSAATIQLTHNNYDDHNPHIADDGKVVWQGFEGGINDAEIYLYDSATGNTTQITNNSYRDENPQISDGKVVWEEYNASNSTSEIWLYNISTRVKTQITNNATNDNTSDISDGKIVWKGWKGFSTTDQEIYLYDIATGTTTLITNNNLIDHNPHISNGKVVWGEYDNRDWEIYFYDIATNTITQITNNTYSDDNPQISNDKIVWESNNGSGPRIMLYDTSTGITNQIGSGSNPQVSGDKIVWQGWDGHYDQVSLYSIASEVTSQLTNDSYNHNFPDINSSGEFVWEGWDGSHWEIFLRNSAPEIPQINGLSGGSIIVGDTYSEDGAFADSDSTSWTATVDYGDGAGVENLELSGNSFSLNHQYNFLGAYSLTVTVTDDQGNIDTQTVTVNVNNPGPNVLTPIADSYIKQGSPNENEGSSTFLRLQSTGHNRALVAFDESQIQSAVGSNSAFTAKLQLTITDNGNNWGTNGRTIELHRLTQNWVEGNGFIDGNNPSNRGTGSGTTWNCSTDSDIHNQNDDCSGSTKWNMTNNSLLPFVSAVTATTNITNNQTGVVELDVTSDVQSFLSGSNQNYGWLIKKTDEGQNGRVNFGSRETGNSPKLVITNN